MAKTIYGLVVEKFEGRTDKAGAPYIHHLLHVANTAYSRYNRDIRLLRVGLLHDIMEDTDLSLSELMETQGVTVEIVQAVIAMTHLKNETYSEYIERVAQNSLARRVKICDLEHNMDLSRLPQITANDVERYCKYLKALEYLKEVEEMAQDFSQKELYIIGCSLTHSILEQKKMLAELQVDDAMYSNFRDWLNAHEELLSKVARLQDITIRHGDNLKNLFK